jgi:hypothetical protein
MIAPTTPGSRHVRHTDPIFHDHDADSHRRRGIASGLIAALREIAKKSSGG